MFDKHRFVRQGTSLKQYIIDGEFLKVDTNRYIHNNLLKPPYSEQHYLNIFRSDLPLVPVDEYSAMCIRLTDSINDVTTYEGYITEYWLTQFAMSSGSFKNVVLPAAKGLVAFRNPIDNRKKGWMLAWNTDTESISIQFLKVADLKKNQNEKGIIKIFYQPQVFKFKAVTNNKRIECDMPIIENSKYIQSEDHFIDIISVIFSNFCRFVYFNTKRAGHYRGQQYIKPIYKSNVVAGIKTKIMHIIHTDNP